MPELCYGRLSEEACDSSTAGAKSSIVTAHEKGLLDSHLLLDTDEAYDEAQAADPSVDNLPPEACAQVAWIAHGDGTIDGYQGLPDLRPYCGHPVATIADWLAVVHPQDRDRMHMMWEHAQVMQRAFATECRLLRHDGDYHYVSLHVIPLRVPESNAITWLHSAIDITARKQHQLERDLRQRTARAAGHAFESTRLRERAQVSEARFQRLLEANVIGIAVVRERTVVEANDAFLRTLGRTHEELLSGRVGLDEITASTSAEVTERAVQQVLSQGFCAPFEKEYIRRDGSRVPALVGAALVDANPPQFVTFAVDLTLRNQLEQEREEAHARASAALEVSRNLDAFFAAAAHDIRSPVSAALGMLELAQSRAEQVVEALSERHASETIAAQRVVIALNTVQANMDRLVRMTQVLFDVARARSDTLVMSPAACDLVTLVRSEVDIQRVTAPDRTIQLQLPADQVVEVTADADRIAEVLANCVSNALKYSDKQQPVTVRLELAEDAAYISVDDQGVGLPPEEQLRIWEPFHRAPGVEPISSASGGLGLGLHICRRIVELHTGGRIGVASEVGRGSTFWFSLPLAAATTGDARQSLIGLPDVPLGAGQAAH